MRVLEVSLRKAGFTVTTAVSVNDALDKLELNTPDLIISETTFPDGDGFELPRRVRATPDWSDIPFIFLTAEGSIENKIRGLELGVDDYLTKPIYIKEIVTRINILLQKRQRLRFEERKDGHTRFAGRVADMPVVDVIQTIEISRKSGVIQFTGDRGRSATIYFRDGRVIDAEAGALQGEDAIYRLLTWNEGEFEVVFRTVRRREVITTSSQGLLMEGMRRLDEWSRLLEQLPALTHRFEVDAAELAVRLGDVPDDNNTILRLMDGKRTLLEIIDASDVGDLECLQAISRLYFEELLIDLDHGQSTKRITGQPMPLVEVDSPSPIEDAASGPASSQSMTKFEEQLEKEHLDSEMERASDPAIANESEEEQAVDEAAIEEENPESPGALLGGYRQSSLRLIDEAVAAAQAIEPSLFTDEELAAAGVAPAAVSAASSEKEHVNGANGAKRALPAIEPLDDDDDSIPHEIAADEPARPNTRGRARPATFPRDDSGLRMIGSLGRDRAEASGELLPAGAAPPPVSETQRELVTILPRRVTREMPMLPLAEEPTPTILAPRAVTANEAPSSPRLSQPLEVTRPRTSSMFEGSGVSRHAGPGLGPILLFILAALLGTIAVWLWVKKGEPTRRPLAAATTEDASTFEPPHDAAPVEMAPDATLSADAALPVDAAPVPADGPPAYDKNKEAKKLLEAAQTALNAGNYDEAIVQAEASLKLRKTVRAHHVRANAYWKQGKIDDAIAAVGDADDVLPEHAPSWDLRGRILWAAGRKDAARFAFEQFLLLQQDGARSDAVRELLRENK